MGGVLSKAMNYRKVHEEILIKIYFIDNSVKHFRENWLCIMHVREGVKGFLIY